MCLRYCKTRRIKLDGKNIILRRPRFSDLKEDFKFFNSIAEEDIKINTNRKLTLKEEKEWFKKSLEDIRKNRTHKLFAVYNREIIGQVSITKNKFRQSHSVEYGISIRKDYRNKGLGTILSKIVIEIAKKDPEIKILYLDVFANNNDAIKFYKKLGFRKTARLPKRIFYKGKYTDKIVMDYPLNKI